MSACHELRSVSGGGAVRFAAPSVFAGKINRLVARSIARSGFRPFRSVDANRWRQDAKARRSVGLRRLSTALTPCRAARKSRSSGHLDGDGDGGEGEKIRPQSQTRKKKTRRLECRAFPQTRSTTAHNGGTHTRSLS